MKTDKYDFDMAGVLLAIEELFESECDGEDDAQHFNGLVKAAFIMLGYSESDLPKARESLDYYLVDGQYDDDVYLADTYLKNYDYIRDALMNPKDS
jgi:hypothetical protein